MPTLTVPRSDVSDLVTQVMADYHAELDDAGVTVGLLAQWPSEGDTDADDPHGSCLKLHGYPCAAVVKITPYRQRVQGVADAVITLDGVTWKTMTEAERVALVDHELTHLELARDQDGHVKSDDAGRPKLKMRLHDVQAGWFVSIARRHGAASFEVKQARETFAAYRQQLFEFDDDRGDDEDGVPPVVRDAFAALLSVGHTEGQARAALDAVPDKHRFRSVADLIDAVYQQSVKGGGDDGAEDEPGKPFKGLSVEGVPVETQDELNAVVRETLSHRAAGVGR